MRDKLGIFNMPFVTDVKFFERLFDVMDLSSSDFT